MARRFPLAELPMDPLVRVVDELQGPDQDAVARMCSYLRQVVRLARPSIPAGVVRWVDLCAVAAEQGDMALLAWAHAHGAPTDPRMGLGAAKRGDLEMLRWADEHGCDWQTPDLCDEAARNGHLELLAFARERGCPWFRDDCLVAAAERDQRQILLWIRAHPRNPQEGPQRLRREYEDEELPTTTPEPWIHLFWNAVRCGNGLIRWLRAQTPPCPWDECLTERAATRGDLEMLQWLHIEGCPPADDACTAAAAAGHLEALAWLVEHGFPFDRPKCAKYAARNGHLSALQFITSSSDFSSWNDVIRQAAHSGHVHVLDALRINARDPIMWVEVSRRMRERALRLYLVYNAAVEGDQLAVLQWAFLHHKSLPHSVAVEELVDSAARRGRLEIVRWLVEHDERYVTWRLWRDASSNVRDWLLDERDGPGLARACRHAATSGNLDLLKWARSRDACDGGEWWDDVCALAASWSQWEVLLWARRDCQPPLPWDGRVTRELAARNPSLLQWALESGCPPPPDADFHDDLLKDDSDSDREVDWWM